MSILSVPTMELHISRRIFAVGLNYTSARCKVCWEPDLESINSLGTVIYIPVDELWHSVINFYILYDDGAMSTKSFA